MAIQFNCSGCGKSYKVSEDNAGKRFKCSQCQTVGVIPQAGGGSAPNGGGAPPGADSPQPGVCPQCGAAMAPGAVICVQCGHGVPQGEARQAGVEPPARPAAPRREIVLPWRKFITAGILIIAVLLGWFLVVRPMKANSRVDSALAAARESDFGKALEEMEALQGKVPSSQKERVERLTAMMRLGKERLYSGKPTETVLLTYAPGRKTGETSTRLLLDVRVKNIGQEPIVLHQESFYLFGASECVFAGGTNKEFPEGTTVPPGGTGGGVLGFFRLPGSSMSVIVSDLHTPRSIIYNDGKNYAAAGLSLMVIGAEAGEEGEEIDWEMLEGEDLEAE